MSETYDMAVIGGGPGGYVAAIRARQLGLSVVLAEKERVGGVCLNHGCIPTKALLSDVEGFQWVKRAAKDLILDRVPSIDFGRMMSRKNTVVDKLVTSLEKQISALGVRTVQTLARVAEPGVVLTENGETLHAKNIVIATGSRSTRPPISGVNLQGVLTTRQMLALEKPPERLVIVGGGIIGQEFAALFAGIDTKVTVLELLDRILLGVDGELARKYASMVQPLGVRNETGVRVQAIETNQSGLRVVYEKGSQEKTAEADVVLLATGRRPFSEGSGMEELGADMVNGALQVDRYLRTSLENVYAIGDVLGKKMLAHVASYQGEVAAENIAGLERPSKDELVPCCVFTLPQIAWVGPTEQEASAAGLPFRTSTFPLSASGKAMAMGESLGWVKLIEHAETKKLISAHLMGPHVSELIGELTLAIHAGMSASDIVETIHAHPTLSEAVREAALGLQDGPIHAAARTKSFPVSQ
ncbi:MAG: dihydrolipoyl dehydrogenase [Thermodesulfobacteriota bacterium]